MLGGSLKSEPKDPRGQMSTLPYLLGQNLLGDPTDYKIVMISPISKLNQGRTFCDQNLMVMGTKKGKLSTGSESLPGCWWVKPPQDGQGFQLGRSKNSCCFIVSALQVDHAQGHWKEVVLLSGIGALGSRFLVRDQIRWLTVEEHGPRVQESWVPTPTRLLNMLCELE